MTSQQPLQQELNFDQAKVNANDGMNRAVLNAESHDPEWAAQAYDFLKAFLQCVGPNEFMAEEVRTMAAKTGFTQPPSNRAWGAVIQRASRDGIIEFVGYQKTKNPMAHCTPAGVWKRK